MNIHMNQKWCVSVLAGILGVMGFHASAELVRVTPMPAVGPGYHSPNLVDINDDGADDLSLYQEVQIPLVG